MIKVRKIIFSFLLLGLLPLTLAFVHPPKYALKKWTARVKSIRTLHIKQTRLLTLSGRSDQLSMEEEVWILRPGLYRRTARGLQTEVHWVVDAQRAGRIENGHFRVEKLVDVIEPHEMGFFSGSSERLATLFRQSGIDPGQSHWVLEGETEGLAIGELRSNRFIFEKENYFPLSAHLGTYSYFFPTPRPAKFRTPYPAKIEIFREDQLKETIEVHDVQINAPISKSFFEISTLLGSERKSEKKTNVR